MNQISGLGCLALKNPKDRHHKPPASAPLSWQQSKICLLLPQPDLRSLHQQTARQQNSHTETLRGASSPSFQLLLYLVSWLAPGAGPSWPPPPRCRTGPPPRCSPQPRWPRGWSGTCSKDSLIIVCFCQEKEILLIFKKASSSIINF